MGETISGLVENIDTKPELVMIKRRWIPRWLFLLFCPDLVVKQPFKYFLLTKVDPFTKRRIDRKLNRGEMEINRFGR